MMPYTHAQSRGSEIFPREGNRSLNRTFGSVLVHAISPSRHPHRIGFFSIKNASYEGNKFRDDRPSLQAEPQFKTTLYNQVTYSRNKSYAVSPLDVSKTKRLGSAAPGGRQKKAGPRRVGGQEDSLLQERGNTKPAATATKRYW